MTLFPHTKDFHYPRKIKTCFLTRAGGRLYVLSEVQRIKKSPATCLRPPPLRFHAELCPAPSWRSQRSSRWVRSYSPRAAPSSFSSPLPNAIHRGWSDGPQNIKHTFQMPHAPRTERFLLANISLFKDILETW